MHEIAVRAVGRSTVARRCVAISPPLAAEVMLVALNSTVNAVACLHRRKQALRFLQVPVCGGASPGGRTRTFPK